MVFGPSRQAETRKSKFFTVQGNLPPIPDCKWKHAVSHLPRVCAFGQNKSRGTALIIFVFGEFERHPLGKSHGIILRICVALHPRAILRICVALHPRAILRICVALHPRAILRICVALHPRAILRICVALHPRAILRICVALHPRAILRICVALHPRAILRICVALHPRAILRICVALHPRATLHPHSKVIYIYIFPSG